MKEELPAANAGRLVLRMPVQVVPDACGYHLMLAGDTAAPDLRRYALGSEEA
jgi:hypothetical protein